MLILKNQVFLSSRRSLDGLERSGRPVANISTQWRPSKLPWLDFMAKKTNKLTSIRLTSIKFRAQIILGIPIHFQESSLNFLGDSQKLLGLLEIPRHVQQVPRTIQDSFQDIPKKFQEIHRFSCIFQRISWKHLRISEQCLRFF